jgi:hypothetical protein
MAMGPPRVVAVLVAGNEHSLCLKSDGTYGFLPAAEAAIIQAELERERRQKDAAAELERIFLGD